MKSGIDWGELIKVNIISIVLFCLTIIIHFVFENNLITIAVLAVWLVYAIYVNYVLIIRGSNVRYRVMHAGGRFFMAECRKLCRQIDSLEDRDDVFDVWKDNDRINEMYELVCRKVMNNVDAAIFYMKTYDYVNKPSHRYLDGLIDENKMMVEKLNSLIEMLIEVEHSSEDLDDSRLDDLIESLREITQQNHEKARYGD